MGKANSRENLKRRACGFHTVTDKEMTDMQYPGTLRNSYPQRRSVIQWVGREPHRERQGKESPIVKQRHRFQDERQATVPDGTISSCPNAELGIVESKYRCQFCAKPFRWCSHWQAHERTHTGERPFKCDECDKAFIRSDGLRCHKLIHTTKDSSHHRKGVKTLVPTRQNICHKETDLFPYHLPDKKFPNIAKPAGRKELKCDACEMVFSKNSALEIHSRVHTGVKPYPCSVCDKAFSIYGNLKRHLLIHTGERPYICSTCSCSFNNPSHLTRHVKKKHCSRPASSTSYSFKTVK